MDNMQDCVSQELCTVFFYFLWSFESMSFLSNRCVLDNIAVKASNKVCYYQGKQALWWQPFGPTHCGTRLLMLPK
jgi:hypothetical protein